jgi:hypothetical protein
VNSSTLDPDKKKGFVIGLFKKISHLTGIIIRLHDLFETGYDTYVWLHPYAEGLIDALKDYLSIIQSSAFIAKCMRIIMDVMISIFSILLSEVCLVST